MSYDNLFLWTAYWLGWAICGARQMCQIFAMGSILQDMLQKPVVLCGGCCCCKTHSVEMLEFFQVWDKRFYSTTLVAVDLFICFVKASNGQTNFTRILCRRLPPGPLLGRRPHRSPRHQPRGPRQAAPFPMPRPLGRQPMVVKYFLESQTQGNRQGKIIALYGPI